MVPIYLSTGTFTGRINGRNTRLLSDHWRAFEADGFELMVFDEMYAPMADLVRLYKGIPIPVVHADKSIGELLSMGGEENTEEAKRRFLLNCAAAERVGSGLMVLHLWGGPASDHHIEHNLGQLEYLRETALGHGLLLTVENVVCAVGSPLERLMEAAEASPGIRFTVDTKMAEFHRELAETVACDRLFGGGLAAHLHVNDYGGGYKDFTDLRVLHIGEGHVDFEPFFRKVIDCGYGGYATVEATSVNQDGSINFEKINRSLGIVRERLM